MPGLVPCIHAASSPRSCAAPARLGLAGTSPIGARSRCNQPARPSPRLRRLRERGRRVDSLHLIDDGSPPVPCSASVASCSVGQLCLRQSAPLCFAPSGDSPCALCCRGVVGTKGVPQPRAARGFDTPAARRTKGKTLMRIDVAGRASAGRPRRPGLAHGPCRCESKLRFKHRHGSFHRSSLEGNGGSDREKSLRQARIRAALASGHNARGCASGHLAAATPAPDRSRCCPMDGSGTGATAPSSPRAKPRAARWLRPYTPNRSADSGSAGRGRPKTSADKPG